MESSITFPNLDAEFYFHLMLFKCLVNWRTAVNADIISKQKVISSINHYKNNKAIEGDCFICKNTLLKHKIGLQWSPAPSPQLRSALFWPKCILTLDTDTQPEEMNPNS